jgi:HAE1 family hydrophobic/amphiphilic exporter-1
LSWLTKISLRNRSIVTLAVVAVIIVGFFAISSLKEELIPNLKFPYLTVVTLDTGTSPSDVERTITTPLEQAIKAGSGIKEYDSFSNEGMSLITVQYEFGTDMQAREAEVQQAVSGVQQALPQGAQAPQVAALNFATFPVVQLAVSSSLPPQELATLLGTQVVPRLQAIPGVQAVTLSGIQTMQLQIVLRPQRVLALGVSPATIMSAVQQANLTSGAGAVTSGSIVYPVTVTSSARTVAAFKRLVVSPAAGSTTATLGGAAAGAAGDTTMGAAAAGQAATTSAAAGSQASGTSSQAPSRLITLGQVADVRVGPAPLTAITRTNGKPSIGISISKSSTGNTVTIANAVAKDLPAIARALGGKATVTTVVDQSTYIKESITSMWREGLVGALFAVLIIFAFLRSWRSTLIAGVSIPLSVIGALIILWSRGESLNMLTLGGLTIAIGRVIDDSIVVIENTYRHLQEGDDIASAAYTATREVSGAITASTLTTVAVFLPLGFVHGLASEFFRPFALTVTFALACSLLVALTVVPVLATWILSKRQVGHREPDQLTGLQRAYLPILRLALDHKAVTLVLAAAIFFGTIAGAGPQLKTNLFDNSAQNTMTVTQQLPLGTSLDATVAAARQVETVLKATKGIEIYQMTAGSTGSLFGAGGGTNASSSMATFTIETDPNMDKMAIVERVRAEVAPLKGAGVVTVSGEDSSMGGSDSNIEVRVSAADPTVLRKASDEVLQTVKTIEGLADVTSNLSEGRPAVSVVVDQQKAAAAGVGAATVSQYATMILSGFPLGSVPTTSGPLPAELMVPSFTVPPLPGAVATLLQRLPVPGAHGMVPLSTVATIAEAPAPVQVTHVDGARTATITASVVNNNIGAASGNVTKALDKLTLPKGATWQLGGASQMIGDVFRTLGIAMLIAIMLVYIIMVATFRSLLNPLILLVSIPFAAVGAVLLLLVTGTSLGMPSLIGLLMLIGIVVTNAIVLLDLVEQFRRRGMDARTAVIEGGRRRLRPILMTAVATILALMPMALGLGKGGFLSTPLAVVVIGGLFTSTVLTLVLVPVLYVAFDRLRPHGAPVAAEPGAAPLPAAGPAPVEI